MSTGRIASLWRGEVPLARVLWEYTIGWATILNLIATGAALIVFIKQGPVWLGLLLHFAAVPLNAFLVVSIWRAAERESASPLANIARIGSVVWFAVMFVI
jgi:uncharacterized membrane protein